MERCDDCGFTYDEAGAEAAGAAILDEVAAVTALVEANASEVTERRTPETWTALEYACHLRDVLLVQRERVLEARRVDRPQPPPMGRDERVDLDGYADQDPVAVARQLADAAALFANVLTRVGDDDAWGRTLVYNYPTPSERNLRWVAVHTLHEARHHAGDVRAQLG